MIREFAVWAPRPAEVVLEINDRRVKMEPAEGGWWKAEVDGVEAGDRYGFSLDGGSLRPDPRSLSQPEGVDGRSEVVDHSAWVWHDRDWRGMSLRGSVIYEMHVGTFSPEGTFKGAIAKLGHLVELGIDIVEVMPLGEFSGRWGWGYDGVDLFAPHHCYGGPDGLKAFVDACHSRGIGVVIDVVYNHLGPAGNYLPEFGPYLSDRHQTNWGAAVNFDGPGSDEVRRFVVDNAMMWLRDYHVDGLRLDAVHAIIDDSAVHILAELAGEVDALAAEVRRPLFLIAESDLNDPKFARPLQAGGLGMDALWADEWHHAVHAALSGERSGYYEDFGSLQLLEKALRQAWVYDGQWSPFRQRHHGTTPKGLRGHQFVVCTQNHDQIGNRAVGERLSALVSSGRLRIAAALLLTSPFTPMVFQGEEWGASTPFQYFTDHRDTDLARAVSDGRKHEFVSFGWDPAQIPDPQSPLTFTDSKLRWDELDGSAQNEMLAWYRELIALRRLPIGLADPRPETVTVEVDEENSTLVIGRAQVIILVNLGPGPASFAIPDSTTALAVSDSAVRLSVGSAEVPSDSVAILQLPARLER